MASGIGTPTRAVLARIDRKRKKKGSNDEWRHPHDPDAKIAKMKDGRTHLAHTAQRAKADFLSPFNDLDHLTEPTLCRLTTFEY
jgi:hypothetical protein